MRTIALWTAKMVGQLIDARYGVKLSKSSVCRLLSQLGLTPQRPLWRAYPQRPEDVQRRFGLNLMSAVSAQGEFRFMVVKGRVGAVQFIEFIKRLLHHAQRIVFLIVDGHPAHKANRVQRFCESVSDRFRLFFLPPYSPEWNPDERVWNDLKNNAFGRQAMTTPHHLKAAVIGHMRVIQKSPDRVRSHFQNETTQYAA